MVYRKIEKKYENGGGGLECEKENNAGGKPDVLKSEEKKGGGKDFLRAEAKKRIGLMTEERRVEADKRIFEKIIALDAVLKAKNIMIFCAKGHEPSTDQLRNYLAAKGKNVFLPVIDGDEMRAVGTNESTKYRKNIYGIDEPIIEGKEGAGGGIEPSFGTGNEGTERSAVRAESKGIKGDIEASFNEENRAAKGGIEPSDLDVIIVPLVAFDKDKNRLGRGKGYYDRFLSKTSAVKIGTAYKAAEVEKIDVDIYDVKMDIIITEG
ncbi:MAG: 5-formyltetrahydrofolate cyclo-ligase [Clostridiales bacterium]|nr:5-formyltetrahydrofolate cyclo-ligase [Clostridiales bacterium]